MKITIEPTSKIVELEVRGTGCMMPARIWQGETDTGTPVQVYITRIAPEVHPEDPRVAEFGQALKEVATPRASVQAIPLRLIL